MKKIVYAMLLAAVTLGFTACEEKQDIVEMGKLDGIGMVLRGTSVGEGTKIHPVDSITVDYNNLIGLDLSKSATLNGQNVTAYVNPENGMQLIIATPMEWEVDYELVIPSGMVYRQDDKNVYNEGLTLHFTTKVGPDKAELARNLTNPNATPEARALYEELLLNYGSVMYSGAMGGVAWETEYSDYVAANNGYAGYPKVVGFDYIHLYASPANWINYGDITPVKTVWEAGSIPTMTWHWNVPDQLSNVLSSTVTEMPSAWGKNIELPAASFALAEPGNTITINISDVLPGCQISFQDGAWKGIVDEDGTSFLSIDYAEGAVNANVNITSSTVTMVLTPYLLDIVQSGGLKITGCNYTVQSVTFDSVVYNISNISYNTRNFSALKALTPGTPENLVINADIKKLAGYLSLLQDAGIPVLFRPLHEANGDFTWGAWFWWGYDGPDAVKGLWRYLRDKLEGEYGINNLIWVWTMDYKDAGQFADIELVRSSYPGDEYVDIVGTDIYPDVAMTDQTEVFNYLNEVIQGHKMLALSEVGNLIDPYAAADNHCLWSWFMNWYDPNFSTWNNQPVTIGDTFYPNPWAAVANCPYVVNR